MLSRGFQNKSLAVRTQNGLDDTFLEHLYFTNRYGIKLRAPIGSTTDGLSTPRFIRMLPGYDATGDDWFCGGIHDAGYRGYLEVLSNNNEWRKAWYTQRQCDELILDAMETQGVGGPPGWAQRLDLGAAAPELPILRTRGVGSGLNLEPIPRIIFG